MYEYEEDERDGDRADAEAADREDGYDFGDPEDEDQDDEHECDHSDERACEGLGCVGDGTRFADPGGNSALRAASRSNPRNLPCPTCEAPNRLTPADRARGYQCNSCADRAEAGW